MFKIPINDERIQTLTREQIDLMIYSSIIDDPEKLSKLENYFYDPEFDEEFNNLDKADSPSKSGIFNFKISKPSKKKINIKEDNYEDYGDFLEV